MDDIDWKRFFLSAEGRLNRQPWWLAMLLFFAAQFVIHGLFGKGFIAFVLVVFLIYAQICICARRVMTAVSPAGGASCCSFRPSASSGQ